MVTPLDWIERYEIRSDAETHGGWAILHIDSKGFLGVVSDYGNYAYHWSSFEGDFKRFLSGVDWDYLYGKLTNRRKVYDGTATVQAIQRELDEQLRAKRITANDHMDEQELITQLEVEDSECGFRDWLRETTLSEPWHLGLAEYRNDLQCEMFCKKIWPKFIAALKEGRHTPLRSPT